MVFVSFATRRGMSDVIQVFAEARGFREEANRARALARTTRGRLRGELDQIAVLYERIADGRDPDHLAPLFRTAPAKLKQLRRFSAAWPDE